MKEEYRSTAYRFITKDSLFKSKENNPHNTKDLFVSIEFSNRLNRILGNSQAIIESFAIEYLQRCILVKVERFSLDPFQVDSFVPRYYLVEPVFEVSHGMQKNTIRISIINKIEDYKMFFGLLSHLILDELKLKDKMFHWVLILFPIVEHSIELESSKNNIFDYLDYKPKLYNEEIREYLRTYSFNNYEIDSLLDQWLDRFKPVHVPEQQNIPDKVDFEREYFNAMTDGQMGDYDDFKDHGGNIDDIEN